MKNESDFNGSGTAQAVRLFTDREGWRQMALTLGNHVAEQSRPYRGAAELRQCIAFLLGHAVTRKTRYGLRSI